MVAWLIIRYVFGWIAPFLFALLTARMTDPVAKTLMSRFGLKRGLAASISSILILSALGLLVVLAFNGIASYAGSFINNLPELLNQIGDFFNRIQDFIRATVSLAPEETRKMTESILESFSSTFGEIPAKVSAWALRFASSIASVIPKFIMFFVTYAISVFFISGSYPEVNRFIMRQIPPRWHKRVMIIKEDFLSAMVKWFKAQFMLMGITFVVLSASFTVLKIPYGLIVAAVVAIIDALPVFGTGTILIPWAVLSLIGGETSLSIGLAVTYGMVSLIRSIVEPRIVGGQLGISPVATLMAMYIGYCTVGVLGMIFFPFALMMIKQLNDKGYVKLWK